MKLAIMQPYFFPYIGYFQLMNSVNKMVIYDNIKYTKKGWINRNRILVNGKDNYITLPLKKDSDNLNIIERFISDDFQKEKQKFLNKIKGAYIKAPFYKETSLILEKIISYNDMNLFNFILNSLIIINNHLDINVEILVSSSLEIDHLLKSSEKVKAICKHLGAEIYINPIGGIELYNKDDFKHQGIELKFLKTKDIIYKQFDNEFVPNLSIIDVMMFNSKDEIKKMLNEYELI